MKIFAIVLGLVAAVAGVVLLIAVDWVAGVLALAAAAALLFPQSARPGRGRDTELGADVSGGGA